MNTERENRFLGLFFMSARIGALLSRFLLKNSVHCLHRRTPVTICCISMRRHGGDNACPVITQHHVYNDTRPLDYRRSITGSVPNKAFLHCVSSPSALQLLDRLWTGWEGHQGCTRGADFNDKGLFDVELRHNSLVKIPSGKSALIVLASTCILRFLPLRPSTLHSDPFPVMLSLMCSASSVALSAMRDFTSASWPDSCNLP